MENETQINWNVGLADEERRELEHLVDAFKEDCLTPSSYAAPEDLREQMVAMKEKMIHMSAMLLELDKRVRSLYEVFRLFHKKTEMMNQRISDVVQRVKIGKSNKEGRTIGRGI
jgi:hypothetical protein